MFGKKGTSHEDRIAYLAQQENERRRKAEAKRQAASRRGDKRRSPRQQRDDLDKIMRGQIPTRRGF